jgi:Dyp-type peroxidase family
MTRELELADIQGIVINGYARAGFPKARHFFLHIAEAVAGRRFIEQIFSAVTTSMRWSKESSSAERTGGAAGCATVKPKVTLNIGFTLYGLHALGVPINTLRQMPAEFIEGMAARSKILGDVDTSAPDHWDPIWRESEGAPAVHAWITLNAQIDPDGSPVPELEEKTARLRRLCAESNGGVAILAGHAPAGGDYQEASALLAPDDRGVMRALPNEHFGFRDGIGNPVFDGQLEGREERSDAIGGGKLLPDGRWRPLATGEFLLGYADESQEIPPAPAPVEFVRNCTFMVYRKLHQNVASFRRYIDETAALYQAHCGIPPGDEGAREARETIMAKMAGRWRNGVPLMAAPTYREAQEFWERYKKAQQSGDQATGAALLRQFNDFKYRDDPDGIRCPMTSHVRRTNTRDMLDPESDAKTRTGSSLNDRRRILRRGLPYGAVPPDGASDDGDHGILFIAFCASLFRQFELVQQQWIQYGLDFNAGNDTCPLAGQHGADAKFVIPVDPQSGRAPFICSGLPQFVTTRGGGYFFVPSITALRMIAMGVIDPT